ncbi:hypothetical protein QUB19_07820 [Microcoleus sp. B4-C5]|uniref:hypothetical protein n=1 Tax=unclassified Microcoleus TaxID=2642155 RepID=UPI002FCF9D10
MMILLVEDLKQDRRVVRFLFGGSNDESLATLWERQRELSTKRPAFWKLIMQASNKIFLEQFNDTRCLDKTYRFVESRVKLLPELSHLRRPRFCSIKEYWDENPDTFLRSLNNRVAFQEFVECLRLDRVEPSCTGPPKGFVPLPDAEIGGCARNDSLIAPAI